jgi:hypothetical protein
MLEEAPLVRNGANDTCVLYQISTEIYDFDLALTYLGSP